MRLPSSGWVWPIFVHPVPKISQLQKQKDPKLPKSGRDGSTHGFTLHQATTQQRHGPCGEAMPTRGRVEGWQNHAAEGGQGADATSMIPPRTLWTTDAVLDAGALCPDFLFAADSGGQQKKPVAL